MRRSSAPPNFIVIMTDQQRWDTLGCNGNGFTRTPSADRMAREGVRFRNAFTSFPLCTPARASAWTGTYPHTHAIVDCCYNIDDAFEEADVGNTMFDLLKAAGYETCYIGKWHLGDARPRSIDIWSGFNSLGGHWEGGYQAFQNGTYKAKAQTDRLIGYLHRRAVQPRPFIAVQSYYPPHDPFSAPAEFYAAYRGKGVPFAGYYAAVSALDAYVGEILETLATTGLSNDTIVILCSDHGETFLYRGGTDHKATCHDDSIRVPYLMWGTGHIAPGVVVSGAVSHEDLAPTLLDYAGVDIPSYMQGETLRPVIEGRAQGRLLQYIENTTDQRDEAAIAAMFTQRCNGRARPDALRVEQRGIWTSDWKVALDEKGNHLLFDLRIDPEEEYNLYGAPRSDAQNRYLHFADMRPVFTGLVQQLRAEASRLKDSFGVELADRVLAFDPWLAR